ncbi:VUT family protein, partial [Actinokineospora sp.]|uniref:VUT family protein n=1 Tax=Actinokineospora sp. TaxID=1872133 RepID=UPI003D6C16D6
TNPTNFNEGQGDERPVVREYWTTVGQIREDIARATGRDRRRAHATPSASATRPARAAVVDDQARESVALEPNQPGRLRKGIFVGNLCSARRDRTRRALPAWTLAALLAFAYLGTAVGANVVTSAFGLVPAGFGWTVTAGTYCAGLALAFRDAVQDAAGTRRVVVLVVLGCLVSALVAEPGIAVASAVAFLLAEALDMAVYTPLRRRGRRRAVALSGLVGAVVDSIVFLLISGFPLTAGSVAGQVLVKAVWVTGCYLALAEVMHRALPGERIISADS